MLSLFYPSGQQSQITEGCNKNNHSYAGFMLALMDIIVVFWVVTPYRFMGRYQSFGRTRCHRLAGLKMEALCSSKIWVSTLRTAWCHNLQDHSLVRHCHRSLRTYMSFKGMYLLWFVGIATLSACETVHGSLKIIHVSTQWSVTESVRNCHGRLHIKKCHLYGLSLSPQSVRLLKNRDVRSFLF
jgi:hypothetical protein